MLGIVTRCKLLNNNFDKERVEYLRLNNQNDELKVMCEDLLKKCKDFSRENEEFKKRIKEKEVRKQRLSELRARISGLFRSDQIAGSMSLNEMKMSKHRKIIAVKRCRDESSALRPSNTVTPPSVP